MDVEMRSEERIDLLGFVGREVVSDDMDLLAAWLVGDNVREEGDELGRRVPGGRLAQDFAGLGVERGVQRQRAVPEVLEAVSLGAARRERQDRVFAIQRLDRGLLIDAEHRRVLWRVQIQADDLGRLGLEVRIVRGHVAFEPMRSQRVLAPDARHHHVRDLELCRQLSRAPVSRPVERLALDAPLQDARLQRRRQGRGQLPGVPAEQAGQALGHEALAPAINEAVRAVQLVANRRPGVPRIEQQNEARTARLNGPPRLARRSLREFALFHFGQGNCASHAPEYTRVLAVTGH